MDQLSLTPYQAAKIAADVYETRLVSIDSLIDRKLELGLKDLFQIDKSLQFNAETGISSYQKLSGFGYIAPAVEDKAGEYLIVFRGTETGRDWVTDFNCGWTTGTGNHKVHTGFHNTYNITKTDKPSNVPSRIIENYFTGKNPTRIHVIGHSLGGALANLAAEQLARMNVADIRVYTFGAPRVGHRGFSDALASAVGSERIYRVYHPADPVPMVPIWPYLHVPPGHGGYAIEPFSNHLVNPWSHKMVGSYLDKIGGTSWAGLRAAGSYVASNGAIERWLSNVAMTALMGSAALLSMIGAALNWILEKCVTVGRVIGETVIDGIASLLAAGAELAIELKFYIENLIRAIFRFLGRAIDATIKLTTAFLRWVLGLLFSAIASTARRALELF